MVCEQYKYNHPTAVARGCPTLSNLGTLESVNTLGLTDIEWMASKDSPSHKRCLRERASTCETIYLSVI